MKQTGWGGEGERRNGIYFALDEGLIVRGHGENSVRCYDSELGMLTGKGSKIRCRCESLLYCPAKLRLISRYLPTYLLM